MSEASVTEMVLNGVAYVRKDSVQAAAVIPSGTRAVVVVDRGWIFAGDVEDKDGRIYLSRAVHVFSWASVGFAAMVADPKKCKADIRPCAPVDIPEGSEIFRMRVDSNWGL